MGRGAVVWSACRRTLISGYRRPVEVEACKRALADAVTR